MSINVKVNIMSESAQERKARENKLISAWFDMQLNRPEPARVAENYMSKYEQLVMINVPHPVANTCIKNLIAHDNTGW